MTIRVLDNNTVKLITTTQVITSISNAVKELVENALDANANTIEINLVDNGTTLIEVKDNGCGIHKVDAPYMAASSCTSKINDFSDLDSLETYGFRGEALYALSAVSDLTVISKTKDEEVATSYIIDHHGCIIKSEPCHRATGTTIQVRQLFKQVPVRRQLITNSKKVSQDLKVLESLIKSYAMCKYTVRINYKVDGNIIFVKPGMQTLEEAASCVLGKKVTSKMAWVDTEDAEIRMKLMLPVKETQNVSEEIQTGTQYVFVNNRPIKHKDLEKTASKIILEAFGYDSSSKKRPIFLLYMLVNAGNIDVNLEPNKTSILFKDQQIVHDALDKRVKDFYGIQEEKTCQNEPQDSQSEYLDYTQRTIVDDEGPEWPACKKRKLVTEENVDEGPEECGSELKQGDNNANQDSNFVARMNPECDKQVETAEKDNLCSDQNKNNDGYEKNIIDLLPVLNLSDSDSEDSQELNKGNVAENVDDDSPPFELDSQCETLSQLPVVDLGEDFDWNNYSTTDTADTSEKENARQNENTSVSPVQNKSGAKRQSTLIKWSKGRMSDLKGGTDVQPCNDAKVNEELQSDSYRKNICDGFIKFTKKIRPQLLEKNPDLSIAQTALMLSELWKKLSSEERGYYRDVAHEEKLEFEKQKQETSEKEKQEAEKKQALDSKRTRNRLLKALDKMKEKNSENKKNLLLRTIVPWDMDLKKVTESFLDNPTCENNNLIVGTMSPDLYIVHKYTQIWLLNIVRLKKELNVSATGVHEGGASNTEQLLKQWFSTKDDLSVLYPLHVLS
ncbi:PMS1 protein homolog 1 [Nomia melanderi]|uniref:PMS1 protein homolog 1 n=1 Tax=Nomia melanderi TaxID=2448451 RepID=UPI003FCDBFCB